MSWSGSQLWESGVTCGIEDWDSGDVQARVALVALEGVAPGQVFSSGKQPRFLYFLLI